MPAAAQLLFGKPADRVTIAESAMLAGLLKAPSRFSPLTHLAAAQARAGQVLDAMVASGHLSAEAAESARREPAAPIAREPARQPDYYLDWAFGDVAPPGRGPDGWAARRSLPSGRRSTVLFRATWKRGSRPS
jgi:penicillin-binding protein 1A